MSRATGPRHLSYRPDIDGLRAVAVLAVLAYHAFPSAAPGGFVGVDVFFVISGYLISGIILQSLDAGSFSFRAFYVRRILRIFPALIVTLLAVLAAGWFALLATEYRQLGSSAAAGSAFVPNILFWREAGYFDTAAELKPLLHLWSLGVEEQFYFLWPLTLFVAWRLRRNVRGVIVVVAVLSFVLNVIRVRIDPTGAFFLPFTRLWELLAGAMLADIALFSGKRSIDSRAATVMAAAGLAMIVAAVFVVNPARPFPGWWALLPVTGTALVIAAGGETWLNRRVLANPVFVFVGLISYPLYLWHWPLLSLARHAADAPGVPQRLVLLGASIVLAWLTYRAVEHPIRFGDPHERNRKAAALLVGMSVAGAIGLAAATGRVTTRLDRKFHFLSSYTYAPREPYRGGTCLISNQQTPADFLPSCVDRGFGAPGKVSVLLWGDSHAAQLHPGFRRLMRNRPEVALAQYSADSCGPLIPSGNPRCDAVNQFVLQQISRLHPDVVVLAGSWRGPVSQLPATIAAIRERGTAEVIVVGPVPWWREELPRAMIHFMQAHPFALLPARMKFAPEQDERAAREAELKALVPNARYVSALDALCNRDGCLTMADGDLVAWDRAHLTDTGSTLVARAVMRALPPGAR